MVMGTVMLLCLGAFGTFVPTVLLTLGRDPRTCFWGSASNLPVLSDAGACVHVVPFEPVVPAVCDTGT